MSEATASTDHFGVQFDAREERDGGNKTESHINTDLTGVQSAPRYNLWAISDRSQ